MKRLSLLRHADAEWGPKGSKDFDRVLSIAGQGQCLEVAKYIEQQKSKPDLILCSPAKRALETFSRVKDALKDMPTVETVEALYLSTSKQLIEIIQQVPDDCNHLLIIGHNPTLQETCWLLSGKSDSALIREVEKSFPPATYSTHTFDIIHWSEADKGRGILKDIFKI